jgi:hypothetical protein
MRAILNPNMSHAAILACALVAGAHAQAAESLCKSDERIVFSCPVSRARTVSVCVSAAAPDARHVQYRFGSPGHIELAIPSHAQDARTVVDGGSGGGRSHGAFIRFRSGDYAYTVMSLLSTPSDPETGCNGGPCERLGVNVDKGGKTIARLNCRGTVGAEITDFPEQFPERFGIPPAKDYWPDE